MHISEKFYQSLSLSIYDKSQTDNYICPPTKFRASKAER